MIALLISATVFTAYVIYVYRKYGVLKSISESYYRIPNKAVFTLALWAFAIPVAIAASSPIMFLAVAGICFVGAAPAFKGWETEMRVHVAGAISGIVLGLTSLIVEHGVWYVSASYALIFAFIYLKKVENHTWWVEVTAFYMIIIGLLISRL